MVPSLLPSIPLPFCVLICPQPSWSVPLSAPPASYMTMLYNSRLRVTSSINWPVLPDFFFNDLIFYHFYVHLCFFFLQICVMESEYLELELEMVVSCHEWGWQELTFGPPLVLYKSSQWGESPMDAFHCFAHTHILCLPFPAQSCLGFTLFPQLWHSLAERDKIHTAACSPRGMGARIQLIRT